MKPDIRAAFVDSLLMTGHAKFGTATAIEDINRLDTGLNDYILQRNAVLEHT